MVVVVVVVVVAVGGGAGGGVVVVLVSVVIFSFLYASVYVLWISYSTSPYRGRRSFRRTALIFPT